MQNNQLALIPDNRRFGLMDMKQSVLEKIFSNLNVYQLQRVVLVNKRFNRIIRNSKVIHNKFQLKLNKQKMESPEIAVLNRIMKKHRIKFNGFNISFLGAADRILDLDEFEMFLHTSVTSLVLNGAILDLATLKYLLDEVPNLTHLRLLGNQILAVNENAMDIGIDHVPELHSLRSLIVKDSSIDGNNQNPFGREDLFDNANNVVYIKALVSDFRLICNKPHVRHLTLESCEEDFFCNLLTAEIQHNIEFSLTYLSLSLGQTMFGEDEMDNLEFFIDNQQFLTSLEIHVVPVFRCLPTILNMQFLIDLEISICNLDMMNSPEFNVKNYTVNSLKVGFGKFGIGFRGIQGWSFRSMRNFLCLFVNVQYMEVKIVLNNNLNQLKEPAWMFHLDPLQSLNVAKFDISYVRVDSLATTSKTPDVLGKTLKWLRIKQMQSLKIGPVVNATYGDWWSFAENNKQLETLIIRQNHDSKISRESIQMLIANLPDLQKFKTYPCVSECSECVVICNCQQRFNRRHYFEGRDLLDLLDSDYEDDHDDDLISSESF